MRVLFRQIFDARGFLSGVTRLAMSGLAACSTLRSPVSGPTDSPAITQADLRARLSAFSDDSMLGRSALTEGHKRATSYLAAELRRMHVTPAGEQGTYFQTFEIRSRRLRPESVLLAGEDTLRPTVDFKIFAFGRGQPRAITDAPVVYGGIVGDTASQITRNQASNRVVLLGVPADMNAQRAYANVLYGPESRFGDAVAVMIMSLDYLPPNQRAITSTVGLADTAEPLAATRPTSILVSRRAARVFFGDSIDRARPGSLGRRVTGKLVIGEVLHPARNVIGILPGTDSLLNKEYVALGAHSDHLGITVVPLEHDSVRAYNLERRRREGNLRSAETAIAVNVDSLRSIRPPRPDSIYNGADDDGSGSVALLEIAEHYSAPRNRPHRSLLFVWHAAEEMGLVGSGWFTDHPTVPLDSIIAQLNLDMVGRGGAGDVPGGGPRFVEVIGASKRSSALQQTIESVNRTSPSPLSLNTSDPTGLFCRSDQWSYARFGIPIAFFTTGLHADYHQVTDEAQYIDYSKLQRVTILVTEVAGALANTTARFEPAGPRPVLAPFCSG